MFVKSLCVNIPTEKINVEVNQEIEVCLVHPSIICTWLPCARVTGGLTVSLSQLTLGDRQGTTWTCHVQYQLKDISL